MIQGRKASSWHLWRHYTPLFFGSLPLVDSFNRGLWIFLMLCGQAVKIDPQFLAFPAQSGTNTLGNWSRQTGLGEIGPGDKRFCVARLSKPFIDVPWG
jgi:hypothetical protein